MEPNIENVHDGFGLPSQYDNSSEKSISDAQNAGQGPKLLAHPVKSFPLKKNASGRGMDVVSCGNEKSCAQVFNQLFSTWRWQPTLRAGQSHFGRLAIRVGQR